MSPEVVANYTRYLELGHDHYTYTSLVGTWNVWDDELEVRICLEPGDFEQDMEKYVRKAVDA